ncbi:MAG TPA: adenylate/guanylate cyclase domain-containing protein [Acidimicrobiia bacterium]|nr:adenylate/guanylate cyclase domain-containing protein [Acidimicrobiia bacterium]
MSNVRYAKSGDLNIAYRTAGEGDVDVVYVPGFVSHIDLFLDDPKVSPHFRRLASFSLLVVFDKRGTGLSDPWNGAPTLDERMDDIRAVMDDAGVERAVLFGVSEGGPLCLTFSATYPDRVSALVLYASGARFTRTDDYPFGLPMESVEPMLQQIEESWGDPDALATVAGSPSRIDDPEFKEAWARARRMSASPKMAADLLRMNCHIDVRHLLPLVSVPTLVLHRAGDQFVPVEHGRYLAEHLPGARYVELEGVDHVPFFDDDDLLDEIEEFVTGKRTVHDTERVLATVLFTDVVGSTERAAEVGDRRWRELLDDHDALTLREVERFGGRLVKLTGDGALAVFDRPGRALSAARTVLDSVASIGLQLRAGLHAGEVELRGDDVGGIAVHIAARVSALAQAGSVFTSATVKDLVVGSDFEFTDRGSHELKGVPGTWNVFEVKR